MAGMTSLRVIGGTLYVVASFVFLYWRVQVSLHDRKCPRGGLLREISAGEALKPLAEKHQLTSEGPGIGGGASDRANGDRVLTEGSLAASPTSEGALPLPASSSSEVADTGDKAFKLETNQADLPDQGHVGAASDGDDRSHEDASASPADVPQSEAERQPPHPSVHALPPALVERPEKVEFPEEKPHHSTLPFDEKPAKLIHTLPPEERAVRQKAFTERLQKTGISAVVRPQVVSWLADFLERSARDLDVMLQDVENPAELSLKAQLPAGSVTSKGTPGDLSDVIQAQEEAASEASYSHPSARFLSSPLTVLSLLNTIAITAFLLKEACLGTLSFMEAHRLVEMALAYVFVKLIFFVIVLESVNFVGMEWLLLWVCFFGMLKVLERLAKERFQRLTASPSATLAHHARTLVLLLTVLLVDACMCFFVLPLFPSLTVAKTLLLAYEPAAVALETTQTLIKYVFHLVEEFPQVLAVLGKVAPFALPLSPGVSGAEWRASVVHHTNAVFEVSCTSLTLAHCVHLWQLHGFSFHIIDIVLFLNARSLCGKLVKRARSFLRWRATLKNLQSALPDASADDISSFADDCAICKEPMAAAKRLPCGHLFHLSCLRSWLDQGSAASHSCPSCRRPLRPSVAEEGASPAQGADVPAAEAEGRRAGGGGGARLQAEGPRAAVAASVGDGDEAVRGPSWLLRQMLQWAQRTIAHQEQVLWGPGAAGAPAHLGAEAGEARAEVLPAVVEDLENARDGAVTQGGSFNLSIGGLRHRVGQSEAAGRVPDRAVPRQGTFGRVWGSSVRLRSRVPAETPEEAETRLVAMAAQVEEILPHVPFNTILQDLRRSGSVMQTVNNLMDSW